MFLHLARRETTMAFFFWLRIALCIALGAAILWWAFRLLIIRLTLD